MGKFKAMIDELELKELPLHEIKFTWPSSHNSHSTQSSPASPLQVTMTKNDRLFSTTAWEEFFHTAHLYAWVSTISDHCQLILQGGD
jgi:hypothetical protein